MATASTGWKCTHSASVSSETNTTATVLVKCYWQNDGWNYQIGWIDAWVYCNNNKQQVAYDGTIDTTSSNTARAKLGEYSYTINKTTSTQSLACHAKITSKGTYVQGSKYSTATNVTISAKPSYSVSYNANGGAGAPAGQVKWYGTNLTLSSSTPSRTGYTFAGWNTKADGSGTNYKAKDIYTSNASVTLYAKWTPHTYSVNYNANGGANAPAGQVKTYGVNLTLSSSKPTRTNYNFLGWSTSANGGVVYKPGDLYKNNSAVTLYAVWQLGYKKPRITNFNAYRCTSDGAASETGTYVKASFDWSTDYELVSMYIDWTIGTDWPNRVSEKVVTSGTSGSVSQIVGGGNISTETTYSTRGWVNDGQGSTYSSIVTIGTVKFPIDVKAGGTGVAIGKVAEKDAFEVGMEQYSYADIHVEESEPTANARYLAKRTDTGTEVWMGVGAGGMNHGLWSTKLDKWIIYSDGTDSYLGNGTGTYKIGTACGRDAKSSNSLTHTNFPTDQYLVPDMSFLSYWNGAHSSQGYSNLTYCKDGAIQHKPIGLYHNASGTTGTITLSSSAANYNYIEIFFKGQDKSTAYNSVRVYTPNNKKVNLNVTWFSGTTYGIYTLSSDVTISGTSLTRSDSGWSYIGDGTFSSATNNILICSVVGYK